MAETSDILVIGGGIAGLSAAAALAQHARVTVLEAEDQVGFHSSGRSATMVHYALGDRLVRDLTLASRAFFDRPPDGFSPVPLGERRSVLVHARADELPALERLADDVAPFGMVDRLWEGEIVDHCPILKLGEGGAVAALLDRHGLRLDPNALLQAYARQLRGPGGRLVTGARVAAVKAEGGAWTVATESGDAYSAGILINAAGAWADVVAALAEARPVGVRPLRRTIITFDVPSALDPTPWPFTKTVGDVLYFAPESGRLFASPMDEVPTDPCDAQPEDYDVALAAWRMEERTMVKVERIHSRWAGLRSFAPDRHPVAGFDAEVEGFFWLVGQGGFGLQTSPVMAAIAESLIVGRPWPVSSVSPEALSPARFLGKTG